MSSRQIRKRSRRVPEPTTPREQPELVCLRCERVIDQDCRTLAENPEQCTCVHPCPSLDGHTPLPGHATPQEQYRQILRDVLFGGRR